MSILAVLKATRMSIIVFRSYTNVVLKLVINIDIDKNINTKNNRGRGGESGGWHAKYNGAIFFLTFNINNVNC